MTREEAIKIFNTVLFFGKCDCPKEEIEECLKMAIEALEQKPCEDAISRQAVTQVLLKYAHSTVGKAFAEFLVSQINDLPPVTPQSKMGHWINIDETHSKCDRCEVVFEITSSNGEVNYCPNCGIKMKVEELKCHADCGWQENHICQCDSIELGNGGECLMYLEGEDEE